MTYDIFISYAWSSEGHRKWVRCLADHLHLIGYNVGIDANVKYGESLNGFMKEIAASKHVLMIVDENYVKRANCAPNSGVAIENRWIEEALSDKCATWLGVICVDNPRFDLPSWLASKNPKCFDFNFEPNAERSNVALQIEDLWRWAEDLPTDKTNAICPAVIRKRMYRVERVDNMRDPGLFSNPDTEGTDILFKFEDAPQKSYTMGYGDYAFKMMASYRNNDRVAIYADYLKAVGLIPNGVTINSADSGMKYIRPGRSVDLVINNYAVLLNEKGCICVIHLKNMHSEKMKVLIMCLRL